MGKAKTPNDILRVMAKSAKKMVRAKAEPTLHDVMGRLDGMTGLLGNLQRAMITMNDWMKNADVRFANLERGQNKLRVQVEDIQDDLTSALAAVDKDTEMLYNHERRLKRLEARRS